MNYQRIYDKLIAHARATPPKGYSERHHILPRCLGGGNESENLIDLSARQHFVAHLLLAKLHGGKLIYPVWHMSNDGKHGSRKYEWVRKRIALEVSKQMKGKSYNIGRKHTPEELQKMKERQPDRSGKNNSQYGKSHSPEILAKIVEARKKNGSYTQSEEQRQKGSISKKAAWKRKKESGYIRSPAHCAAIAKAKLGKKVPAITEALKGRLRINGQFALFSSEQSL